MIGALARVPVYRLAHALGMRPLARPINVTVSTTFRCNSRCLTCNVYERPVDELTVDEWDRTFAALGRSPVWFTFSGGEPFLRKDLADIIEAAWRRCRPKVVNIPTNGTYADRVVAGVERLAPALRGTQLVINVSLDAVGERNDVIRGLKGDYEKANETFRRLRALKLKNLTVGLHSVISSHNVRDFPAISDTLMGLKPDQYIAEPAEERVELQTIGTGITPKPEAFDPAIAHLERRLRDGSSDGLPRLTRAIRLVYYGIARRTIRENRQVIPCYAAIASVHFAANGDVWGCCTKAKPLGNLRASGFDFDAIWRSEAARLERADIKAKNCACPLANAAYTSILCDAGALVQVGRNLVRPGKGSGMKATIVIPTYDEADALPALLERVLALPQRFEILVVDDNSPDGTGELADQFAARDPRVSVLHRPGKLGLGSAYRDGFARALAQGADVVFEMDADHSHNPKYLPALLEPLRAKADVTIGSRYVHGIRVENWPFRRLLLSRFANMYVSVAAGLPSSLVSDATSGFRGYRREVLEAIRLDRVRSNGYSFQVEMAYRAWRLGFRLQEVPICFEEHYLTSSKMSKAIVWEAIWRTPLLRLTAPRGKRRPAPAAVTEKG